MANNDLGHIYLKSLVINEQEVPKEMIRSTAYIENLSMTGSKLILKLFDQLNFLKDDLGVEIGSLITVQFASEHTTASYQEEFVLLSMPTDNDGYLVVNAQQAHTNALSVRESIPVFTPIDTPMSNLGILAGSIPLVGSISGTNESYVVNAGATRCKVINSLSNDNAAAVWISRGSMRVRSYAELAAQAPVTTLSDKIGSPYPSRIQNVKFSNLGYAYDRALNINYQGWSMTQGSFNGGSTSGVPIVSSSANKTILDNRSKYLLPLAEITTGGNDDIEVGDTVELEFTRPFEEDTTSEPLPKQVIILRACHFEARGVFRSLFIVGIIVDANDE